MWMCFAKIQVLVLLHFMQDQNDSFWCVADDDNAATAAAAVFLTDVDNCLQNSNLDS